MLREIKPEETLEEVDLYWSPFWIRVYDVSIGFKSQKIVTIIGGASREFVEWDSREESWLDCSFTLGLWWTSVNLYVGVYG